MSNKIKIVLDRNTISEQLLNGAEMGEFVKQVASERAPAGCEIELYHGKNRLNVEIKATDSSVTKRDLQRAVS